MSSSYLTSRHELYDARYATAEGDILVEIKRTSNVRDLRDALLALAYALSEDATARYAVCVLTQTRFSAQRLHEELARFRVVVRPGLGEQIFLAAAEADGGLIGELPPAVPGLQSFVAEAMQAETQTGRVSRQAVKAYLVECWTAGSGPLSTSKLRQDTGASYPTVVAALEDLARLGVLSKKHASGALLREPDWEVWRRLAEDQAADRKLVRFIDPSGQARPPSQLATRLRSLWKSRSIEPVRLGGVLGAQLYDPELDITAAPRLDLYVDGSDTQFIRKLDAALVPVDDESARADVVLHIGREPARELSQRRPDELAASPLDCLADLLQLGYQAEARDFAHALAGRARTHATA